MIKLATLDGGYGELRNESLYLFLSELTEEDRKEEEDKLREEDSRKYYGFLEWMSQLKLEFE